MSTVTYPDCATVTSRGDSDRQNKATPSRLSYVLCRKLDALRALALFAGVAEDDLVPLATACLLRHFERGRRIGRLGARDECIVLMSGRAKSSIVRGTSGGNLTLATFEAGDIVSETCWATGQSTLEEEAIALADCDVIFLPRRALEDFLHGHGEVAVRLLVAAVNKLNRLNRLAARNHSLDVGDRLYCRLVEFAGSLGRRVDGGIAIDHGLQQSELASSIGASREAVNRQLSIWRNQGLVECRRGMVLIKDVAGLRMAVSPQARTADFESDPPVD